MPRKKAAKVDPADEQRQMKLESLLKQFDAEVESRIYDMRRAQEQVASNIDHIFRMSLLKLPPALRNAKWEDSDQTLADEMLQADEMIRQVEEVTAKRATAKKRVRGRGGSTVTKPQQPPPDTPQSEFVTPFQPPRPLVASTPAITPKFDPQTVRKAAPNTIRRQKPDELLMSLKGSPVIPEANAGASSAAPMDQLKAAVEATSGLQERPPEALESEAVSLLVQLRDNLNKIHLPSPN